METPASTPLAPCSGDPTADDWKAGALDLGALIAVRQKSYTESVNAYNALPEEARGAPERLGALVATSKPIAPAQVPRRGRSTSPR